METQEQVVLVDENDVEIGLQDKLAAHIEGNLHRAISVIVHDGSGRLLLQKRQAGKYHSQGQWTNACCSHPRRGEAVLAAAQRRLREEMGIDCPLRFVFRTIYRQPVGNGLVENELVHVFLGHFRGPVTPDPDEADGYQWITLADLQTAMDARPEAFSAWWRIYVRDHGDEILAAMRAPAG